MNVQYSLAEGSFSLASKTVHGIRYPERQKLENCPNVCMESKLTEGQLHSIITRIPSNVVID